MHTPITTEADGFIPAALRRAGEDHPSAPSSTDEKDKNRIIVCRFLWRTFWVATAIGCVMFGLHMACFCLRPLALLKPSAWDEVNPGMCHQGRWDSNLALSLHFVGGAYMMLLGPLQFIKAIRRNCIMFRKWSGRLTVAGCALAALGGMHCTCVVGATATAMVGQQVNVVNVFFGLSLLICALQLHRHAKWAKDIERHKLWACRVAGISIGNMFARLHLLLTFVILGEDPDPEKLKAAVVALQCVFHIPFILSANEVWRREQLQEWSTPPILCLVLSSILLLVFVGALILQSLFGWIPFVDRSFDHDEDLQ